MDRKSAYMIYDVRTTWLSALHLYVLFDMISVVMYYYCSVYINTKRNVILSKSELRMLLCSLQAILVRLDSSYHKSM